MGQIEGRVIGQCDNIHALNHACQSQHLHRKSSEVFFQPFRAVLFRLGSRTRFAIGFQAVEVREWLYEAVELNQIKSGLESDPGFIVVFLI